MTDNLTKDKPEQLEIKRDDPDAELVALVKSQLPYQTSAYSKLMARHEKLLFAICMRLLDNPNDADDVVQEIMLKVYSSITKFESRSTFKTWLVRIAMNTCYSMRSKLKRNQALKDELSDYQPENQKSYIPTDILDAHKLLSKLEPIEKELLTLRFVANLKFEEISEVTGLALSATKMRIYRAQEKLKASAKKDIASNKA
jgi:RNA polymerase sigma-70 factor (ECF subfamily)